MAHVGPALLLTAKALFLPGLALAQASGEAEPLRFSTGQASGPFLSGGGGARLTLEPTPRPDRPSVPAASGLRRVGADRIEVAPEHRRDGRAQRAPGVSAEFLLAR